MAFSDTPKIGVDLDAVIPPAEYMRQSHRVLAQVWGTDGLRYTFGKASAALTAGLATVTVNATTGAATATGGTYKAPPVAVPSGSYAWFAAASV